MEKIYNDGVFFYDKKTENSHFALKLNTWQKRNLQYSLILGMQALPNRNNQCMNVSIWSVRLGKVVQRWVFQIFFSISLILFYFTFLNLNWCSRCSFAKDERWIVYFRTHKNFVSNRFEKHRDGANLESISLSLTANCHFCYGLLLLLQFYSKIIYLHFVISSVRVTAATVAAATASLGVFSINIIYLRCYRSNWISL